MITRLGTATGDIYMEDLAWSTFLFLLPFSMLDIPGRYAHLVILQIRDFGSCHSQLPSNILWR
jgi:hypothetical protein